jgi:hypothetical protein
MFSEIVILYYMSRTINWRVTSLNRTEDFSFYVIATVAYINIMLPFCVTRPVIYI